MQSIQPFNFDSQQVRVIQADDGEPMFVASDVARALGYAKPENAVSRHCKRATTTPKQGGGYYSVIRESDVYRLIVKSALPSAERFEAWVFEEVLPSIRKTGQYQAPGVEAANVPATMALVECAANLLRASDSGKVVMLRKAGQAVGADTSFLPDYTEDSAPGHIGAMDTASLTQLLRDYGLSHSAAAVNQMLHEAGILERRKRKDRVGNTKGFWCLTEAGLDYGKNVVSPQSPRETQPHYYRDRFSGLLGIIGLEVAA